MLKIGLSKVYIVYNFGIRTFSYPEMLWLHYNNSRFAKTNAIKMLEKQRWQRAGIHRIFQSLRGRTMQGRTMQGRKPQNYRERSLNVNALL